MKKVIGFKRGTPTKTNIEPHCDSDCFDYSGKNINVYEQQHKIMEITTPIQSISDPNYILISNITPVNVTLTIKQVDNDITKMEITSTHKLFLMDNFYLIIPTDSGVEIYNVTNSTKLYSSSNGFIFNEQDMFHCVRKFYDMHVFVLSNNTNHCILILDETFKKHDKIIIPKINNQLILYTSHWIDNIMIWKDNLTGYNYYDTITKSVFYKTQLNFDGWLDRNTFIETNKTDVNNIMISTIKLVR